MGPSIPLETERGTARLYWMPNGSGDCRRRESEGESARRRCRTTGVLCDDISCFHLFFSSSSRCWRSASQTFFSRSRSARASCVALSALVSRACNLSAAVRCSVRSCSNVRACSLMVSSSSSRRRAFKLTSLAFRLTSASRFAVSSRSFSSASTREFKLLSMPCQFSEASEYWVCRVSICRRSFAWESLVTEEVASSVRLRRNSSFDSRFCVMH
jgi:hypothetical protein